MAKDKEKIMCDCGHMESDHSDFTRGYGSDDKGNKFCYSCCDAQDRRFMVTEGKITLYLSNGMITNWLETFHIPVQHTRKGRHNIARVRYDVWFKFAGKSWHGVQYGDNTEICHCRRIKG